MDNNDKLNHLQIDDPSEFRSENVLREHPLDGQSPEDQSTEDQSPDDQSTDSHSPNDHSPDDLLLDERFLDYLLPDDQSPDELSLDELSLDGQMEMDAQPPVGPVGFPLPVDSWVQMEDPAEYDTSTLTCLPRRTSVWGHFDPYNSVEDQEKEYVGFATLPNQVRRDSMKKGFEFNLMVVGESGLGKSTLINSLFLTDLYKDRTLFDAQNRIHQTVAITKRTIEIVEKGVQLKLSLVDTPGFGDALDDSKSWKAVVDYIDQQFEQYYRAEVRLSRKNMLDNRVHCCLYFISPYGHGLRPIDVKFMKALHEKVNIVPVLAKADCFTPSEIQSMKARILSELDDHRIKIYEIPECDQDEDELFKKQYYELKMSLPFAVVGSNTTVKCKGKRFRARVYPWGVVEVENPAHCDFVHLKNLLVCTYMHNLKELTHETLYENYRMQLLYQKHLLEK